MDGGQTHGPPPNNVAETGATGPVDVADVARCNSPTKIASSGPVRRPNSAPVGSSGGGGWGATPGVARVGLKRNNTREMRSMKKEAAEAEVCLCCVLLYWTSLHCDALESCEYA